MPGPARRAARPAAWADRLVAEVRAWRAELSAVAPWIGAVRSLRHQAGRTTRREQESQSWATIRAELLTPTSLAATAGRIEGLVAALTALQAFQLEPGHRRHRAR